MSVEVRAAKLEERPAICEVITLAFDAESYGPSLEEPCRSVGKSHMDPHDRAENTRILLIDGKIVSVVHVAEREAYLHGGRIPFGFVAMVATHPDYRRRGYMKQTMADAEGYMRRRGFWYAGLLGGFRVYGRSLGWRWCGENAPTLGWRYEVATGAASDSGLQTRPAADEDIPFLSRLYHARYGDRFGAVVRSHEYWRRWSLQCLWEGTYVIACEGTTPVGYFHIDPSHRVVDEIGWEERHDAIEERIFLAAASWAAAKRSSRVGFYVDEGDQDANLAFRRAFGDVPRTFCKPNGQAAEGSDPTPYLPANWPKGMGIMVKFLNSGPGILAGVDSTEALTEVMARHSWLWFDGDTM